LLEAVVQLYPIEPCDL
jgi:hypothetical protein